MIDWPSYNRSLVRRGEILFSYDYLDTWDYELERMNENKMGKPFLFPDSFILAIGYIRYSFQLPYRQTQGIIDATGKNLHSKSPSYGHICKRINKLNVEIRGGVAGGLGNKAADDDDYIMISIDSSGTKITNRGQSWMDKKWKVQNRKGYLKIHIAVNIKTKEILALEVTDEKVHDGRMLKKLVNQVLDGSSIKTSSNNESNRKKWVIKIKSVSADGAYDSNANFQYLQEKRITPGIKVRRNSIISKRNNKLRNKEVMMQTKDLLKWKKKRKYGHRWMAETVFSTLKRTFGEYVSATKFQHMVKEMMIKVSLYNLFRRL